MDCLLFIYGTLRLPAVQREIIGREVELIADKLDGYATEPVIIDCIEFSTLVPDQNSHVDGALISITSEELARIDGYEPPEYRRISTTTINGRAAWVYIKA